MRHFDLLAVVDEPQSDRAGGQPESETGQKRDARQAEAASIVAELRTLRLANEAAIAWTQQVSRCTSLSCFETTLANLRKITDAIEAGDLRIADEERVLQKMIGYGWPTTTAEALLETMRGIQRTLQQHRERLEREVDHELKSAGRQP